MEVHHHPIAIRSHTTRKKWTHYFWEFLMLFRAVTLGFFVENQREHYIEHRREKQFIVSMVKELEADTVQLHRVMRDSVRIAGLSNLMDLIYTGDGKDIDIREAYYLVLKSNGSNVYEFQQQHPHPVEECRKYAADKKS